MIGFFLIVSESIVKLKAIAEKKVFDRFKLGIQFIQYNVSMIKKNRFFFYFFLNICSF